MLCLHPCCVSDWMCSVRFRRCSYTYVLNVIALANITLCWVVAGATGNVLLDPSRSQKSSLTVKRKDAVNTVAAWISCDWPWRGAEPGFWITKLLHCSVYRKVLTVCLSVRSFPLPAHYSLCCRLGWHGGQRANSHKTNKRISCFSQLKTTFCKLASAHNVGNGTMLF